MTDKNKIWKTCEDNPKYEVSSDGEVRNKKRGNILKKILLPTGYYAVCLSESGLKNGKGWRLHILVAKAFIPNSNNLPQVNHKDGNKLNNNVDNLEWVTAKENIAHSFSNGLHKEGSDYTFTVIHKDRLHEVVGLRKLGLSFREIGEYFGVVPSATSYICYHKTYLKYYSEEEFNFKVDDFVERNKDKFHREDTKTFNVNGVPSRIIIQKDKDGSIVREFDSIMSAAQANGVLHTSIVNNLKGRSKYCGGYKYEYKQN